MKKIEDYFNIQSARYENAIKHNFIWKVIKEKEKKIVLQLLSPRRNEQVLDLGSGPGVYAIELKKQGCKVTCVDSASSMIELVRQKGIEGEVLDVQDFFLGRKFHKIICLGVLEFVSDPGKVLGNLMHHLRGDGSAVIIVPLRTLLGYGYKLVHFFHGIKIRLFSRKEIESFLYNAGFEIEESVEVFGFSYIIKSRFITYR